MTREGTATETLQTSDVTDEVHAIAVALGKSENMRVTAGRKFAALWVFVTTPRTDGAQQVINAGYEPTQRGIWEMVVDHPSYPVKLGTSFRTGQRLLSIGNAPDPEKADRQERRTRAQADRARREASAAAPFTQHDRVDVECNKSGNINSVSNLDPVEPDAQPIASLNGLVAAVKALSIADFEIFKQWFRSYCGAA